MSGRGAKRMGTPCRRFTLLDVMLVMAASAVGFTGIRGSDTNIDWPDDVGEPVHVVAGYTLMIASVLVAAFRLRSPRPALRRAIWQPGAVACFAAAAYGFLFDLTVVAADIWSPPIPERGFEEWVWWIFEAPDDNFAHIIAVVWGMLAIGRRWRAEPGWIDRLGRAVGFGWICWLIAGIFV